MTTCIGSMGRGRWAELDFDHDEAEIFEHGKDGRKVGPLARVPIASIEPEDDKHDPTLDPESHHTADLLMFLAADRMLRAIRFALAKLEPRENRETENDADHQRWCEDDEMARELSDALEWATKVPE